MTKYRILARPNYIDPSRYEYYAQYKFLNLIWRDCDFDKNYPGCARSSYIEHVEEYIDALIHNKTIRVQEKVVKEYD